MRVALLVVALLALASCASAQRFIQRATYDEFGATDAKFLCVGNATYVNVTVGQCSFGSASYCDGTYVYSFRYTQSDNSADPLCMSGNLTSVSRYPVGCGSNGAGYVAATCMNTTQGPDVPSIPSTFTTFARTANFNFTNTPDGFQKVKTGYTSDCSTSAYYQEFSGKPAATCTQLPGNEKGYSSQTAASSTCDNNFNYAKTFDTTTCTGNVVAIQATPYKQVAAKCGATGVMSAAVGPCPSPSTPSTPSYTNKDGNVYAVQTTYADDSCTAVNTTQVNWVSNLCQGTNKYVCTNTTAYPILVNMQYNDGVLCSGSFFQNVTLDINTCKSNGNSGSYKLQCLAASGGSQPGAASSISVSFVTLMIAAFVAMVARQ